MAPRQTRTAAADQAAKAKTKTKAQTETAGDEAAPLEPPGQGDGQAVDEAAAPLEPPAGEGDPDSGGGQGDGPPAAPPAQAAPLEPPAAPAAPPPPPGPPTDMRMVATPGADFEDLVWSDGTPAEPDQMFIDPGAQYTYVMTAREIQRRQYLPGARRLSGQVVFPAGWRVAREQADRMKADLRRLREQQAGG